MRIERYPKNIEMFVQRYLGNYLEVGSKALLIERARSLSGNFKTRRKNRPVKWKFEIPREHPLTFKTNDVDSCKLQVDLSCEMEGLDDKINKQNLLLRVWCWDQKISFREGIDAVELKEILRNLDWKRVILRLHFNLRTTGTTKREPLYHLHIGGDPLDGETSWFPKQIKVPRFPYPPMDIILLSEFILMNFFQEQFEHLRKKPEWESLIRESQGLFQKEYFDKCLKHINAQSCTLLGNLVTVE